MSDSKAAWPPSLSLGQCPQEHGGSTWLSVHPCKCLPPVVLLCQILVPTWWNPSYLSQPPLNRHLLPEACPFVSQMWPTSHFSTALASDFYLSSSPYHILPSDLWTCICRSRLCSCWLCTSLSLIFHISKIKWEYEKCLLQGLSVAINWVQINKASYMNAR